jgi:vancomycin permeability regulator SanA
VITGMMMMMMIIIIIINSNNWSNWNHYKIIQKIQELQKTAILGTAHILRKVLMSMYVRANGGASAP